MGVFLVYSGLLVALAGFITTLRPIRFLRIESRRRGAALLGFGAALTVVGATLPAPLQEAPSSRMRLDDFVPVYQFSEAHQARVHAGPDRVFAAIKAVTPEEIPLYRALTWIRSLVSRAAGGKGS